MWGNVCVLSLVAASNRTSTLVEDEMTEVITGPTCPMSAMCKGMAGKPFSRIGSMIPGLFLIGIGILVLFKPQILAWLIAFVMIMMGGGLLFLASMMHRFGARFDSREGR